MSASMLPEEVELDARSDGRSVAIFADWQFTANARNISIPPVISAASSSFLLDAIWRGSQIAWCPYAYADNDAAIMIGWVQGYPKKLGAVRQTRTFAAPECGSPPLGQQRPICRLLVRPWAAAGGGPHDIA